MYTDEVRYARIHCTSAAHITIHTGDYHSLLTTCILQYIMMPSLQVGESNNSSSNERMLFHGERQCLPLFQHV